MTILKNPQKAIIKTLYQARRPLSITAISEKTELAWSTVRNHVGQLAGINAIEQKSKKWYFTRWFKETMLKEVKE